MSAEDFHKHTQDRTSLELEGWWGNGYDQDTLYMDEKFKKNRQRQGRIKR